MPTFDQLRDLLLPMVLYMMLPALVGSALIMAALSWIGGAKQAAAGAALALIVGAGLGLWLRAAIPDDSPGAALAALNNALTLIPGESSWNRLPWAVLAALCVGRLAYLADVHSSDGWLLRGGASVAIAWWVLPEDARTEFVWLAPVFAATVWATWVFLDRLAVLPGSTSVAICVILALLTAGTVLIQARTARLMDVTIVLAFAFIGIAIVAYARGVQFDGAVPAIAVVLPSLLLMGERTTYEEIHWSAFVLPILALLLLTATLPFTHWPKFRLHLVRLLLASIPLGIALYLALQAGPVDFE